MRNEECVFRLASDGKLRCIPGLPASGGGPSLYQVMFADGTCTGTNAYLLMRPSDTNCPQYPEPAYGLLSVNPPTTCQTPGEFGRSRVFKAGAQLTLSPDTPIYLLQSPPLNAGCVNVGSIESSIPYAATEVDITKFEEVSTTVKHE